MENFCKRFPHLAKSVFDQVDEQSLNLCKEISGDVLEYLDSERFFWIRIIKKYQIRLKDFPKLWKPVIDKTPAEKVKQIAIAVSRFFQSYHLYSDTQYEQKPGGKKIQWPLIAISANHGDLALIQFIVRKIKLKNIKQPERINALFLAASEGHSDIYDFLTKRVRDKNPGKPSVLNRHGRTPLHWAASNGHFEVCKLIIDGTSNKNPAEIEYDGNTPLHFAATYGHLEVCQLIMNNVTDKNPANWSEGKTPLHLAARDGEIEVVQYFVGCLIEKNPTNQNGLTVMHLAAFGGQLDIINYYLEIYE